MLVHVISRQETDKNIQLETPIIELINASNIQYTTILYIRFYYYYLPADGETAICLLNLKCRFFFRLMFWTSHGLNTQIGQTKHWRKMCQQFEQKITKNGRSNEITR